MRFIPAQHLSIAARKRWVRLCTMAGIVGVVGVVGVVGSIGACGNGCNGMQAPPADRADPRLATLTPSLTALVVHLGAQDHLVGVSQHGPKVAGVPIVAGVHPNMEGVLFVEPDIVAIGRFPSNAGDIQKLEGANLDVEVFDVVTLSDLRASALKLGQLLKRDAQAQTFVASLDRALEKARTSETAKRGARVLVVYGRSGGTFYSTGGGDHIADILKAYNATNVAAGGDVSVRLSLERILHLAPDTILHVSEDPDMQTQSAALAFWREAAPTLAATKKGRVIVWTDATLGLNGPSIVGAIELLGRRLDALPR